MAFSISYAMKLCFLSIFSILLVLAECKPAWSDYASPFVLVRMKRNPQRAYTFSGFNPSNGFAAYATSAEFLPSYYHYPSGVAQPASPVQARGESYMPLSSDNSPSSDYAPTTDYQSNSDYSVGNGADEERKIPSSNLTPPSEYAPNTAYNQDPLPETKKSKKKPSSPATQASEDDDEDDNRKSKSSSSASFNAWFPIVFGGYPSSQGNSEAYKDGTKASQKEYNGERSFPGTTVVANSVSNGRSSVASSHAIAYGGEPPMQSNRKG